MRLRLLNGLVLLAFACAPSAAAATAAQAIAALNAERAANGIPATITEVPAWSANCALHLRYMDKSGEFAHEENPSSAWYTPEGAWAGLRSVLADGGSFATRALNPWRNAPIHLDQLLDPGLEHTGYADGAGGACMITAGEVASNRHLGEIFTYPGDGSVGAPFSVDAHAELPISPAEALGLDGPTGTNLLVYAHLVQFGNTKISAASVTGPDGPHKVLWLDDTSSIGMYFSWGGIVVPVKPLKPGTHYTASVTVEPADVPGPPRTKTWSFTTGLRSNSVDIVKPSAGFAAPALVRVEGDSSAPVVRLTSRRAGSDRVLYRARTRPVYGTYFSGWIHVPLGRATVCAESGGAGTEHDPSHACFNITTRRDLQKPSLSLAYLGAHRTAKGWRIELWASARDNEAIAPKCSYRLDSGAWRGCTFGEDSYAIVKRLVGRAPRSITFRATDFAGNTATARGAVWIH
jgi:hypothetical protein